MIGRFGTTSALILCAGLAHAFCEDMDRVATGGGILNLPGTGLSAECTTSLILGGGTQVQCGWPFAYRADEATAAFERLNEAVAACLGPTATASHDQSVNHPDFYDLRLYQAEGQETAVSLKDKAALRQTYVFLRTARTAP
ncbi:hypothetical protein [Loktanella sp. Alg231-35]|uniref:hypothetical protein n=1 Tax=Loktanella sp. Alg231-35 TaxID=1922220 RepID=UPI000D5598FB|nr:hypothetical protein [Loktanella sp. Alg231-35]